MQNGKDEIESTLKSLQEVDRQVASRQGPKSGAEEACDRDYSM